MFNRFPPNEEEFGLFKRVKKEQLEKRSTEDGEKNHGNGHVRDPWYL